MILISEPLHIVKIMKRNKTARQKTFSSMIWMPEELCDRFVDVRTAVTNPTHHLCTVLYIQSSQSDLWDDPSSPIPCQSLMADILIWHELGGPEVLFSIVISSLELHWTCLQVRDRAWHTAKCDLKRITFPSDSELHRSEGANKNGWVIAPLLRYVEIVQQRREVNKPK